MAEAALGARRPTVFDWLKELLAEREGTTYGMGLPVAQDDATGEYRPAMPSLLRDALLGMVEGVEAPGKVMRGEMDVVKGGLTTLGAMPMGGLVAGRVPRGAAGMFAGVRSKTADHEALAVAEKMEKAGVAREAILKQTGWFRDVDGQWKYEISDAGARLKNKTKRLFGTARQQLDDYELKSHALDRDFADDKNWLDTKLGKALDHPELFKAYPDLADVPLKAVYAGEGPGSGAYRASLLTGEGITAKGSGRDIMQTLLHEGTHAVQNRERHAGGGSPMDSTLVDEMRPINQRIHDDMAALAEEAKGEAIATLNRRGMVREADPEAYDEARRAEIKRWLNETPGGATYRKLNKLKNASKDEALRGYMHLAGEVKARNVERRMDLEPDQLRETPPWTTEDIPEQLQIVRREKGRGLPQEQAPLPDVDLSMYDLPAGSDPRYLGAAPDRSGFTFLRYAPKKGPSARTQRALEVLRDPQSDVRAAMMDDIRAGLKLGGADWYNTEELRDWFIAELGEGEGHRQWREFMQIIGTTSPNSNVMANIANATAVRHRLYHDPSYRPALEATENIEQARALAKGRPKGYGHLAGGTQEQATARWAQGGWEGTPEPGVADTKSSMVDSPKPKGFDRSLTGNPYNIAADLHFTRYMAMASRDPDWLTTGAQIGDKTAAALRERGGKAVDPYFSSRTDKTGKTHVSFNPKKAVREGKLTLQDIVEIGDPKLMAEKPDDNEYKAFEDFVNELGEQIGLTGPQVQAALWMGAAKRTGVEDSSQGTFMEIFRNRADKKAAETGRTRAEVVRGMIRNQDLMVNPSTADPINYLGGRAGREAEEKARVLRLLRGGYPDA